MTGGQLSAYERGIQRGAEGTPFARREPLHDLFVGPLHLLESFGRQGVAGIQIGVMREDQAQVSGPNLIRTCLARDLQDLERITRHVPASRRPGVSSRAVRYGVVESIGCAVQGVQLRGSAPPGPLRGRALGVRTTGTVRRHGLQAFAPMQIGRRLCERSVQVGPGRRGDCAGDILIARTILPCDGSPSPGSLRAP